MARIVGCQAGTVLSCPVLHRTAPHRTALHCTALHCTALMPPRTGRNSKRPTTPLPPPQQPDRQTETDCRQTVSQSARMTVGCQTEGTVAWLWRGHPPPGRLTDRRTPNMQHTMFRMFRMWFIICYSNNKTAVQFFPPSIESSSSFFFSLSFFVIEAFIRDHELP
jgi:hypothetical protein